MKKTKNSSWNELMKDYDNYSATTEWFLGYSTVDSLLGKVKGREVLDYGCGTGKYMRHLILKGAIVRGADSSINAIEMASRQHIGKGSYNTIDNPRKPNLNCFPSNYFDAAVMNFVISCIPSKDEARSVVQTVHDKLKIGAPLIICDPHPYSTGHDFVSFSRNSLEKKVSGAEVTALLKGPDIKITDYWRSVQEYFELLKKGGFDIVALKEPTARDLNNSQEWLDELKTPPFLIIKAIRK